MREQQIQYPADFVDRLEILWGEGFLSPGGSRRGPSDCRRYRPSW